MATGLQTVRRAAGGRYNPLSIADMIFFNSYKTCVASGAFSHDKTSPSTRTVLAGSPWRVNLASYFTGSRYPAHNGATITLSNYTNPGNNGSFTGLSPSSADITFVNPAAVSENVGIGVGLQVAASAGYCVSYTELKNGYTFLPGNADQSYGIATHIVPGVRVIGTGDVGGRFMGVNTAPAAAVLNGTGPFTVFRYFRPTNVTLSGQPSQWLSMASTGQSIIAVSYANATSMSLTLKDDAGNSSTFTAPCSPGLALNTWQLLAVTYAAGVATFFINAVQVGTASNTVRTRQNLGNIYFGIGGGTVGHEAIHGGTAHAMTTTEQAQLLAYCRAEYA